MANGGIIGPPNIPTSTTATGVWQQEEQYEAKVTDTWPQRTLFTTKSLRFNDGSSDYLNRTASAGNQKTFTISVWLKRSQINVSSYNTFFSSDVSASDSFRFTFNDDDGSTDDKLMVYYYTGSHQLKLITNRQFRDTSAWYHIVLAVDTTQATSSDRVKIYVNGVQETSFSTATYPSQNLDTSVNANSAPHEIGRGGGSLYYDGYMSEVILVDGQALAPTSFGVTNSDGVWTPIPYLGTYGTNGFNLQFEDAAALGTDSSPNGNTFTVNNLTSIDQSTDYPENNFATMNPLNVPTSNAPTFAEGNLFTESVTGGTSTFAFGGSSTFGLTKGKWYLEAKCGSTGNRDSIGVIGEASTSARTNKGGSELTNSSYFLQGESGVVFVNTVSTGSFSTFTNNDIIGIALDLDNNKLYFRKNAEAWGNSGDPTSGATGTGAISLASISSTTDGAYFISNGSTAGGGAASAKSVFSYNFGSPPYAISSGNTDGNGYGNFEYAVPSGYYSLNTKNLAEYG